MGNPKSGVIFHSGDGEPMNMDALKAVASMASNGQETYPGIAGKLLKPNRGEVAERLNAAVC